jgi:hypothetical protein
MVYSNRCAKIVGRVDQQSFNAFAGMLPAVAVQPIGKV